MRRLVVAALALVPALASAQDDSLALERAIEGHRPTMTFVESARSFVERALARGDSLRVRRTIAHMDRRSPATPWAAAEERLAMLLAVGARDVIGDSLALGRLLAAARTESRAVVEDELHDALPRLLRTAEPEVIEDLDALGALDAERRFVNILFNHLRVRGLRGRLAVTALASEYASDFPASWRSELLRRFVIEEYREEPFGLAFAAGYRAANVLGDASKVLDHAHGVALGIEAYYQQATLALELVAGAANAVVAIEHAGEGWQAGDLAWIGAAALVGYEIRFERLAITPLVGIALYSLRGEAPDGSRPRTGFHAGFDAALAAGYRIPFDAGPHIDLRVRAGIATLAMTDFDARLGGAMPYVQVGFALVHRPYRR